MPEYYLANLEDENPEEVNYASTHPEIVSALEQLHKTWAKDVFEGSGYPDPNHIKSQDTAPKKGKGSTKL